MTQLSKERLEEIAALPDKTLSDGRVITPDAYSTVHSIEIAEMARRLLAAEAQEPVAWLVHTKQPDPFTTRQRRIAEKAAARGLALTPLYTAPPAPVAVPDEMTMQKALSAINQLSWQECTRDAYMLGWNACRAAMLKESD